MEFVWIALGLIVGTWLGFGVCAILNASHKDDDTQQKYEDMQK